MRTASGKRKHRSIQQRGGGPDVEAVRDPWRRAVRFAAFAFAALSLLPVWPVWYFGPWEAMGKLASFWTMLASVPRALDQRRASALVLNYYGPSLIPSVALLGVCLFVGRWWAGRPRGSIALSPGSTRLLALALFLLSASLVIVFGR